MQIRNVKIKTNDEIGQGEGEGDDIITEQKLKLRNEG